MDTRPAVDVDVVDEYDGPLGVEGEPHGPFLATKLGQLLGGGAFLE